MKVNDLDKIIVVSLLMYIAGGVHDFIFLTIAGSAGCAIYVILVFLGLSARVARHD